MFELIDHLQRDLEPQMSRRLRTRFALRHRQAENVLPTLAWLFFAELRWILLHPTKHPILLAGLAAFLTDMDESEGEPLLNQEVALGLATAILESRQAVVLQILETTADLKEDIAGRVVGVVLPKLMEGLRAQVKVVGLSGLVKQLLAEHPGLGQEYVEALEKAVPWFAPGLLDTQAVLPPPP